MLACGGERGDPAEGGPDEDRRLVKRPYEGDEIRNEGAERVVPVGCPVALTVTPGIERDGGPSVFGEPERGASPGVARLTAAVQQDHGRRVSSSLPALALQPHTRPVEVEGLRRSTHLSRRAADRAL